MSAYEPLHHKYRPQTFADLVGQDAIAATLTQAIESQRIAPAYLFTGPRGTGKTSSARILSKSLNCLASEKPTASPCGVCEVCRAIALGNALDVIEIDAASNTGVDNIRELIERSQFAPVQCRYKVYVIDECHMLSVAAFNALLKTLEEPPERIVFVLATTDPQRVLPTIISRCQRFDYRRIPLEPMVAHLKKIAQIETIEITDEAITLVAQIANGGLRDAENLLDQLSLLSGVITPEKVWDLVGAVPEQDLLALLNAIESNIAAAVLDRCRHLMNRGREPLVVLQNLAGFYLNLLIAKTAPNRPDLVAVTTPTWQELCAIAKQWQLADILLAQQHLKDSEVQLKNTTQPRLWLEVTLLGLLPSASLSPAPIPQAEMQPATPVMPSPPPQQVQPPSQATVPTPPSPPTPEPVQVFSEPASVALDVSSGELGNLEQIWQAVIEELPFFTKALMRPHCHLIRLDDAIAYIGIKSEPLLRQAQSQISAVEKAFTNVCQRPLRVKLQVTNTGSSPVAEPPPPSNPVEPSPSESVSSNAIAQPSVSNNGTQHGTQPQISPESIPPQESLSSSMAKSNGASLSPQPVISVLSNHEIDLENISEDEIKKAAEKLAKLFEGELVDLDQKTDEDDLKESTDQDSEIDSQPAEIKISPDNQSIIRGRPTLTDILDEEDIPF